MGDNRSAPPSARSAPRRIAGYDARCTTTRVGADAIRLWEVGDLERHVDRDALLRADDPAEPPYWAYCWAGARVLAERLPRDAGRVLEIGCGLGLPGITAACRGGRVVFLDRVEASLAFVRASLDTNGVVGDLVVADALRPPWGGVFDVVLAAEVLYDRAGFGALATALAGALAPGGRVLLADGHRADTAAFYDAARTVGLAWTREDVRTVEEGLPATVSVVTMRRHG
jgi:predicted nicotinamide N-methyase